MIIAMSETTPDIPNNSPLALARRVKGYIAALISLAQGYLEPDDTAQTRTSNQMEHGATIKLRTHIHRLEYQLRCYILWLAAQMLERANTEPGYLDTLRSFTSNAKAQMARATALSPFHVCEQQTTTINNPEDQPPSNSIILEQELELRRLTATTPSIGGFQILASPSKSRGSSRTPGFKFTPDPLRLVDASRLLARMNRLPKVLKRADAYAVKLVLSTVSDPPFKGQEAQGARSALPLRKGELEGDQASPLYIPPFTNWLPPNTLWSSTEDEAERTDLNLLHYLASSTLIRAGHGPPGTNAPDDLPDLTPLDPLPPPQIRLLNHP